MKQNKRFIVLIIILCAILSLYLLPFFFKKQINIINDKKTVTAPDCEIYIEVSGSNEKLELEEYVKGVIAGEMPASFHIEALKAQAIAARTYALKTTNYGKVAIEPTVLKQVYYDVEKRRENWKDSYEEYEEKIKKAVESTAGQVIVYEGELITAMFHSMSNGMTESAKNYSGTDLPYLQSVVSVDFQNNNYIAVKKLSIEEWNKLLKGNWTLQEIKKINTKKNDTGRIEKVTLGNKTWTGREFRELLNLRSTDFQIKVNGQQIEIITEGYGHGVGMSQFGANTMANNGKNAYEILKHYYQNTEIEQVACKK